MKTATNFDLYPFDFADMLEIGQHLQHNPELRAAWFHMVLDYAPQTGMLTGTNSGAWGHDLTGQEAEALLSTVTEGTNDWNKIWLALMTYSQPRTVSYLLRKKRDAVAADKHMELLEHLTTGALRSNLMLPPWKSFARLELPAANVSELDQWLHGLEASGKARAKAGPSPLPSGWRRLAAKRCARSGRRREVIKRAKERLGADVGAWSVFLEWVGQDELEIHKALETAAATLKSAPEPFAEPKKHGWFSKLFA